MIVKCNLGVSKNIELVMGSLDKLNESITKADALLKIILASDLNNISSSNIYDALWLLEDLLVSARSICDGVANE